MTEVVCKGYSSDWSGPLLRYPVAAALGVHAAIGARFGFRITVTGFPAVTAAVTAIVTATVTVTAILAATVTAAVTVAAANTRRMPPQYHRVHHRFTRDHIEKSSTALFSKGSLCLSCAGIPPRRQALISSFTWLDFSV